MAPRVQSMIAVTYVRDIEASRAFYQLLGFSERSSGEAGVSAWTVMRYGEVSVLLAMTEVAAGVPPLPMLSYLFYEDLAEVLTALEQAGVPVTRTGHPPHALGGEASVLDPDGNTVLLGQRQRSASQGPADDEGHVRFSILREAAVVMASRGGVPEACEVGGLGPASDTGTRGCPRKAEVKLADSLGDSAWVCLPHAEQILVTVPEAFIANHDVQGIAAFMASRRP
jgi:predicted enzyme related to lactoylglutathione lyase